MADPEKAEDEWADDEWRERRLDAGALGQSATLEHRYPDKTQPDYVMRHAAGA